MNVFEEAVQTGVVSSPDLAEVLGAFEESAVSDSDAADAAGDAAFHADDALAGALTESDE